VDPSGGRHAVFIAGRLGGSGVCTGSRVVFFWLLAAMALSLGHVPRAGGKARREHWQALTRGRKSHRSQGQGHLSACTLAPH
jgi:hypothetical protein